MRSPLLAARTAQAIADQVGTDRVPAEVTAMHHAHLYNYLGIPDISGTAFQRNARRHAAEHGATLDDVQVTAIDRDDEAFTVRTNGGADAVADYLVTAGGKASRRLAVDLGLTLESGRVAVDHEFRPHIDRVYAIGRLVHRLTVRGWARVDEVRPLTQRAGLARRCGGNSRALR